MIESNRMQDLLEDAQERSVQRRNRKYDLIPYGGYGGYQNSDKPENINFLTFKLKFSVNQLNFDQHESDMI